MLVFRACNTETLKDLKLKDLLPQLIRGAVKNATNWITYKQKLFFIVL